MKYRWILHVSGNSNLFFISINKNKLLIKKLNVDALRS